MTRNECMVAELFLKPLYLRLEYVIGDAESYRLHTERARKVR